MSVDLHPLTAALGATLDRLEWAPRPYGDWCRMCGRTRSHGHAEGCGFVALRTAVEGAERDLQDVTERRDEWLERYQRQAEMLKRAGERERTLVALHNGLGLLVTATRAFRAARDAFDERPDTDTAEMGIATEAALGDVLDDVAPLLAADAVTAEGGEVEG